ncbi:hypothetical protein ID47_04875 [Candidatus Paracaedibacter acanthamoebae]|uniref:Uncharacterized protein n=1 Tax=Candidatus Odyssella acanthamoebae TaxID=91604 RepID=A0A077AUX3_9PROT|nr:hypothetical protein ID47_04875 [Candidatus Paracaedibacter acanthamoebae]
MEKRVVVPTIVLKAFLVYGSAIYRNFLSIIKYGKFILPAFKLLPAHLLHIMFKTKNTIKLFLKFSDSLKEIFSIEELGLPAKPSIVTSAPKENFEQMPKIF